MWGKAFRTALSMALPAQKLVLQSNRLLIRNLRTAPRSSLPPLIPRPTLFPPTLDANLVVSCKEKKKRKKSQCKIKPRQRVKSKKCSKRAYKCPHVECPVHLNRAQKNKRDMQKILNRKFKDPWKGTKHERKCER